MPKVFSEEQRELALQAVAIYGSTTLAERRLKAAGLDIARQTLDGWKTEHADRLEQIRATVLPQLREKMAEESEALAFAYMQEERDTLEHFAGKRDELTAKDASQAIKNLSIARGVSTDKASALRGLPSEIVEHRKYEDIVRRWTAAGTIDGTAEEITDAETVEDGGAQPAQLPAQLPAISRERAGKTPA